MSADSHCHLPFALHTFHSRLIIDIHRALSFSNVRNGMFLSMLPRISKESIVHKSVIQLKSVRGKMTTMLSIKW